MNSSSADDLPLDRALLGKADALIRRNRTSGVSPDAEELPMLTEVVEEELPELTDALALPVSETAPAVPPRVQEAFSLNLDLDDYTPSGQFQPMSPLPPDEVIERAVDEAVERVREEMRVEQQHAIQEAVAKARAETLHEARQMQQHAVQAAIRQGREEAEINQWPALQAARQEAVQGAAAAMSERLIELDAQISQSLNQWLAKELPPIIASELLGLSERLRVQTTAHMRATLLPELSEQVSKVLESALKGDSGQ
ncbi:MULTISPECIES: hypothetical protein [unclassified Uliginosibacterium]|jgi:hypothetical protein|uniref:hypothetical protein n=1 Tax=unclassified Uliginosibacterium TaxID=2621521 RepID=UPI000C7BB7EF|nr:MULTISPECIES: hypothetical protein [unclassified Uliginosibacterium]MDO6387416.1 hypothetical protein [Uliginosibacterium sp. 31-12]PLK47043.1 hypothetical protein C0V76_18470 [Uliginosibacterium sp. TH139]